MRGRSKKFTFWILLAAVSIGLCGKADAQEPSDRDVELLASDAAEPLVEDDYQYTINGSEAVITKYTDRQAESVTIPEYIGGCKVTKIGSKAFLGGSFINVKIPDSVTEIGDSAFARCQKLEEVTLPENLTTLGEGAFQSTTSLVSVKIPKSVTTAGHDPRSGCGPFENSAVKEVIFEEGMTKIPDYMMSYGGQFPSESENYSVVLPSTLEEIGDSAFSGWGMESLTFPKGLRKVGESSFTNCRKLKEAVFQGNSQTTVQIGRHAFGGCVVLENINLSGVSEIGSYAFAGCKNLGEVNLPDSLTGLGELVFQGTSIRKLTIPGSLTRIISDDNTHTSSIGQTSLEEITFAEGTKKVFPYFLFAESALKTVHLPDSITEIGEGAFSGCSGAEIHLPASLQKIGNWAFSGCENLKEAVFSKKLKELGDAAFKGCTGLKKIRFEGTLDYITRDTFQGVTADVYYYADKRWDDIAGKNYGGKLTWHELKNPQHSQDPPVENGLSNLKIFGSSSKIAAGKKLKLTVKLTSDRQTVKWKSSNKKVATVTSAGVVTMNKDSGGKSVTITATVRDGSNEKKLSYKITSMKGIVKKIAISGKKTVKAGSTLTLKAKVTATKNANKKLKWTSSNTKYATVSNSGKVKAKKAGKGKSATITAAATDGSGKKKAVVIKIK